MGAMAAERVETRNAADAQRVFLAQGWTDGSPIIPPTPELVEEALGFTQRAPDEILGRVPERRRSISVEKVAINGVMAGCRPEYLPVLMAAVEAMCDPASGPHGPTASTAGAGLLLIVNGPPIAQLKINSGVNLFGPGQRANATIGRALRLIIMNCAGAVPGQADRSTLGHAGKYAWCISEDESDEAWLPLHVERGFSSEQGALTTFWGLSTVQVSVPAGPEPEPILKEIARTIGAVAGAGASERQVALVIAGEHRQAIASAGWSKADVRRFSVPYHAGTTRPVAGRFSDRGGRWQRRPDVGFHPELGRTIDPRGRDQGGRSLRGLRLNDWSVDRWRP